MSTETGFWARRRAAVAAEEAAAEQADMLRAESAARAELESRPDDEILAELGLPDPDSLRQGDDFSAFMARAVPERLRRRALRTLWRSNPVLACLDGLNDYDADFAAEAAAQGGVVRTTYQVGKGLMAHVEEMARQEEARAQADAAPPLPDAPPAPVALVEDAPPAAPDKGMMPQDSPPDAEDIASNPAPVYRRMRFDFEPAADQSADPQRI